MSSVSPRSARIVYLNGEKPAKVSGSARNYSKNSAKNNSNNNRACGNNATSGLGRVFELNYSEFLAPNLNFEAEEPGFVDNNRCFLSNPLYNREFIVETTEQIDPGPTIGSAGGETVEELPVVVGPAAVAAVVAATTANNIGALYNNMVAAMNDHLSSTSSTTTTTNSPRLPLMHNNNPNNNNNSSNNHSGNPSVAHNNGLILHNSKDYNSPRGFNETTPNNNNNNAASGIISFPCDFDHMYASMTDGATTAAATATSALGVSPVRGEPQGHNDLTEVKHLKELLLLHLDLIQQQSEQIVAKDKLLAALRQENETLKLRLERMDRRVSLQKLRTESTENSAASDHTGPCSPPNLNSVGMGSVTGLIDQQQILQQQLLQQQQQHKSSQNIEGNSLPMYNETFKIRLNTSGGITTVKQESMDPSSVGNKMENPGGKSDCSGGGLESSWESKKKRRSDPTPLVASGGKRKRGVSCSSSISNDTTSTDNPRSVGNENFRKNEKKAGKSGLLKKEACLTTEEHYYTAVGDPNYSLNHKIAGPNEDPSALEVPNWRIKIYTSCYTMEGTENLDDEIFNKRHLKLENDERRRKRWDVQRIREQRHIEKLKQRQERQNHHATCYNTNHTGPCASGTDDEIVISLWPDLDQIQNLQVDSQLPVSAFGAPIPSFTSSEFSLPWLHTTRLKSRRPKRSTGRRKSRR